MVSLPVENRCRNPTRQRNAEMKKQFASIKVEEPRLLWILNEPFRAMPLIRPCP